MIDLRLNPSPSGLDALWIVALRRHFGSAMPGRLGNSRNCRVTRFGTKIRQARSHSPFFIVAGGDATISDDSLSGALLLFGNRRWPDERSVAAPAVLVGVAHTISNEWHNMEVRNSGAYSGLMPTLRQLAPTLAAPAMVRRSHRCVVVGATASRGATNSTEEVS